MYPEILDSIQKPSTTVRIEKFKTDNPLINKFAENCEILSNLKMYQFVETDTETNESKIIGYETVWWNIKLYLQEQYYVGGEYVHVWCSKEPEPRMWKVIDGEIARDDTVDPKKLVPKFLQSLRPSVSIENLAEAVRSIALYKVNSDSPPELIKEVFYMFATATPSTIFSKFKDFNFGLHILTLENAYEIMRGTKTAKEVDDEFPRYRYIE
jgi:hypothetical protein